METPEKDADREERTADLQPADAAFGQHSLDAALEMALIREYLAAHPCNERMTEAERDKIWRDALLHACLRREEMRARARLVGELGHEPRGMWTLLQF